MSRVGSHNKRSGNIVKFRTTMMQCVAYRVMKQRGWIEVDDSDWDIFWDLMAKNLKRAKRQLEKEGRGKEMDFFPKTYIIPQDFGPFMEEFRDGRTVIWIMKPCGRAQGRGIFLINKLSQLLKWKKEIEKKEELETCKDVYVGSLYIENPFLIGGKKFDLRLYVLVVSFSPLKIYLQRGGLCRFSCSTYENSKDNMKDMTMHLTNVAIQKKTEGYETMGVKWPLQSLRKYLLARTGEEVTMKLFEEIQMIIIKSLLSVQNVVTQDKHCFELYGYDILIDSDLKPWLIEINASPSLSATPKDSDYDLKFNMLHDCLTLIDVEGKFGKNIPQSYGGFDLIYDNGILVEVHPCCKSLLGCYIAPMYREVDKGPKSPKNNSSP